MQHYNPITAGTVASDPARSCPHSPNGRHLLRQLRGSMRHSQVCAYCGYDVTRARPVRRESEQAGSIGLRGSKVR